MRINVNAENYPDSCRLRSNVAGRRNSAYRKAVRKLIAEICVKHRITKTMRKIREVFPEKDMRKIEELLRKIDGNEALIEIRIDGISLL